MITVPKDLTIALAEMPPAKASWDHLNKSERYVALWKIETASDAPRAKRIKSIVQSLASGQRPGGKS